jgi:hypothetical protein
MEPTLLEIDASAVTAKRGNGRGGMRFHSVSGVSCLLLPQGKFTLAPWKPGVYQGDGTETRVNIQFQLDEAQRDKVEAIEERIRDQLEIPPSAWNSSSKPNDRGALLRAKLNLDGPRRVQITGAPELPSVWPANVNAYLRATCVYEQSRASGLLFEVIALDVGPVTEPAGHNPFMKQKR